MARLRSLVGLLLAWLLLIVTVQGLPAASDGSTNNTTPCTTRTRERLGRGWRFARFTDNPDNLSYGTLKPWMLASARKFTNSTEPPPPAADSPVHAAQAQAAFDDCSWTPVEVPHDWAVQGPFGAPGISGGMGRLPSDGIGWYRRNLTLAPDPGRSIFLDIEGAMAYAAVWLNGQLVGGWPYGYASFRLDLTPYAHTGADNVLAVRLENMRDSSRWYPGAGLYRDVWLVTVDHVHVDQDGTFVTTPQVSEDVATLNLTVRVENTAEAPRKVTVRTSVFQSGANVSWTPETVFPESHVTVIAGGVVAVNATTTLPRPRLWGPPPAQTPHLYEAVTTLVDSVSGAVVDQYTTRFGVRSIVYNSTLGLLVNGQHVRVQGTNNHHDLGALGAAFHVRAAERQLDLLAELGCNALRMSHNPPAPALLDLADERGFLVLNEIFDAWTIPKTINDFHQIFGDWHEADLRAFVRRDRNHPAVIAWSFGNEIPEQLIPWPLPILFVRSLAQSLHDIVHTEDPTRPATASLNTAGAGTVFADVVDIESLNYQGEGGGENPQPSFPSFHTTYPNKMLWTSESASTVSTRGTYIWPVTSADSAVVGTLGLNPAGTDPTNRTVSAYELYAPIWASSPDHVFAAQDAHPYVAGEFVWTGFDYLGEPTPFDNDVGTRSSYFGIIDLAGFKKDRFYIYQARWRPDLHVAHILPHWSWPSDRVGQVTPVHVFAAADTAELFVNGQSAGRRTPADAPTGYRFRWDNVTYAPGSLRVETYRDGSLWAVDSKTTAGPAVALCLTADRGVLKADDAAGPDLAYLTAAVVDANGTTVPTADHPISFAVSAGTGAAIVATDNGDPTDMSAFPNTIRHALNGLALAIVRTAANARPGNTLTVTASAPGLASAEVTLTLQ